MAVNFSFSSRNKVNCANIVLPQTASAEPGFQTNTADLHGLKAPPRPWPTFRGPGDVDRIPGPSYQLRPKL